MDPIHAAVITGFQNVLAGVIGACVLILTSLIGVLAVRATTWLKTRLSADQLVLLKENTQTVVRSLEQSPVTKSLDGQAKKEQAILDITHWCAKNNIPISKDYIDALIEEAVQIFNTEIGKYTPAIESNLAAEAPAPTA